MLYYRRGNAVGGELLLEYNGSISTDPGRYLELVWL